MQWGLFLHEFGWWQRTTLQTYWQDHTHIVYSVKNMLLAIIILMSRCNYSHIYFPSQCCRYFGWIHPSPTQAYSLCQYSRLQILSPSAPWELGDSLCQLRFFTCRQGVTAILLLLSIPAPTGKQVHSFDRLHQRNPRWVSWLGNAEEPHSYLSPFLHLLELATSHFTGDPSINSWVWLAGCCCDSCIFLHAEIAAEWVSE